MSPDNRSLIVISFRKMRGMNQKGKAKLFKCQLTLTQAQDSNLYSCFQSYRDGSKP